MNTISWKRSRLIKLCGAVCVVFLIAVVYFLILAPSPFPNPALPSSTRTTNQNHHDDHQQTANIVSHPTPSVDEQIRKKRFHQVVMTPGQLGNFELKELPEDKGLGAYGKRASLPKDREWEEKSSIRSYGMNVALSNAISFNRSVPDIRHPECKYWNYPDDMTITASVVLVFLNEGFSPVMRNVHSIINRSPPHLLKEIVLVDDSTDDADLKYKLDDYIKQFNGKVRVIRNPERQGLMGARVTGARESKGDVVIFLDAHCEVNWNWLPPLLAPIHFDRRTMTAPYIDGIDYKTFEYRPVYGDNSMPVGIFEWGLFYKETDIPPEEIARKAYRTAPYKSPTHAGGLFAIDRNYFFELGAYDPGLLGWGGENYELSFKVWQCGGSLLWVPCSRVGHVYKGGGGGGKPLGKLAAGIKGDIVHRNYKRVVEVWFDEKYKEFFYTREPLDRYIDPGNLTDRFEIKKRLNCKSFQWFMDKMGHYVLEKFPELPPNLHWGGFENKGAESCLDSMSRPPPAIMAAHGCHGRGSQLVRLNAKGQLGIGERCVDADSGGVMLIVCPEGRVDGPWEYSENTKIMKHKSGKCLVFIDTSSSELELRECDPSNVYHQWVWRSSVPTDY